MSEPLRLPPPPFWRTVYWDRYARHRADRTSLAEATIRAVIATPFHREAQPDGRLRHWGYDAAVDRWVRVVLLADGETVHNAMYDRSFKPAAH